MNLAFGLDNGQLQVIDPLTGAQAAKPFQPPVDRGKKHVWSQPSTWRKLVRLLPPTFVANSIDWTSVRTCELISDIDIEGKVLGPLVVVDKQVGLVLSNQTEESFYTYDGSNLVKAGVTLLDGRWQAGPFQITPDQVLVQTIRKLQMFGTNSQKIWEVDFPRVYDWRLRRWSEQLVSHWRPRAARHG